MCKTFKLDIKGYFRDEVRSQFPQSQGVYFVYRGILNNVNKTCILTSLIYIGSSKNLHDSFNEHQMRASFLLSLKEGESLFYTYALTNLNDSELKRVESSLINELLPSLNREFLVKFSYPETEIDILGDRHAFIPKEVKAPSY